MEGQYETAQSIEDSCLACKDGDKDAKGMESFLIHYFTTPLVNSSCRQFTEKSGTPNVTITAFPHLDKVLHSWVSGNVCSRDKDIATLQAFALGAVGPLTSLVEDACGRSLTAQKSTTWTQSSWPYAFSATSPPCATTLKEQ